MSRTQKTERIGRLLKMHANKREDIQEILAGDICAAVGLKNVSTGDTICDEQHPITLESITFAVPVISVAVEPKTKADQEKMGMALGRLAQEDPTFKVHTDPDSATDHHQRHGRVASGNHRRPHDARVQGRSQRRQAAGGVSRDHPQACRSGRQVHPADRWPRSVRSRQDSPRTATSRARATSSSTTSWAASVPKEYIKPIDQGIREAMEGGVLAGYPMVDVKATLYDGSYHDVDSNEMAFKIAGSMAFKEAARKASPVISGAGDGGGSGDAGRLSPERSWAT